MNFPVIDPTLPRISYSRLQSYDRCEYQHFLGYVEKWVPKEKKSYLQIGSMIHELAALWYRTKDWAAIQSQISEWLNSPMVNLQYLGLVSQMMDRYVHDFAAFEDVNWKIKAVEQKVEIPLKTPSGIEYVLVFVIDLVVEEKSKLALVEHKTVGQGKFWTPTELQMDPQTTTYTGLLRALGHNIWAIYYNQFNTYEYKKYYDTEPDKLFRREKTYRTDVEINNFLAEFHKAVEVVLTNPNAKRRFLRRDCAKCHFQEPCFYALKGFDPNAILQENFTKKPELTNEIDHDTLISTSIAE